ncbi:uncharacterized protein LOC142167193 [Nicotiana tabacum]|uniref:Uncharacterized protein LOC142167193 n=1 Tax=Nicotiana tabacum TaxID=4097 RepID=A0AC58SEQ8_TOBAC
MYKFIKAIDEKVESQHSVIKNLEIQVSQLATLMSGQTQGALPSNIEKNPKEYLKSISLRSGKSLDDLYADREEKPQEVEKVNEDILKQLYINIPFTDALMQMPSYAKFLKEILSSKRKLEDVSVVKLTEKCSAILKNKLPQKLGDPGSFTIPCTMGGAHFEKVLCDLGASINLMPFSIFRKLELGKMKDTGVSLQLADQSTKRPKGIIENILVRVDKFVFPIDFIVLEMEENTEEGKLIEVLRKHKRALGWTIPSIKGISPAICMHMIIMENEYNPIVQPQRRLNPAMQEVVKKEVVKLLAAGIIYPISDSPWIPIAPEDQEKTTFTCPQGHKITTKGIEVDKTKIDLIAGLSPPTNVEDDCMKAFEILKEQLTNAPIVVSPDWSQSFEIMCDASDTTVGAILGQKRDKKFRPIYYASRTLNEAQKNYATTEKELLAVVFIFDEFHSYLIGMKVRVFTDHAALKYLLAKKDARTRLLRWILILQEFDLEIKDRKGSENQVADHLSRLENPPTEATYIKEEFSDEHIYTITTVTNPPPWSLSEDRRTLSGGFHVGKYNLGTPSSWSGAAVGDDVAIAGGRVGEGGDDVTIIGRRVDEDGSDVAVAGIGEDGDEDDGVAGVLIDQLQFLESICLFLLNNVTAAQSPLPIIHFSALS